MTSKNICLLRPPMIVPRWAHASPVCPPLGLAYVAASLRAAGHSGVRCVDALGEAPFRREATEDGDFLSYGLPADEIVRRVGDCDVLGVSLMFSHDWPMTKRVIRALRERNPAAVVVAGGEHVSALPEFCLEDCPDIDFAVVGEGEETVVELLDALRPGGDVSRVRGIVRREGGRAVRTPPRARIEDLESIPWPAWDLLPLETYLANGLGYGTDPRRSVPLLASRGCPYECSFCSSPSMWTTRWKARAPECVVAEMAHHVEANRARNFDLYDLTAILSKDWIADFCRRVIEKEWSISWQMPAGTRSEALDAGTLRLMRRSGLRNISYAPESGSPATLKRMGKKVDLGRMSRSIESALEAGMNVKLNIIMGFPRETRWAALETTRFLARMALLGVHDAYVACFTPYPGSALFEELRRSGRIGALDSGYFLALASYSDLRRSRSFSEHISDRELAALRLGSMLLFYLISYVSHPSRLFRLLANFMTGREESRLDTALKDLRGRSVSRPRRRAEAAAALAR